MVRPGFLPADVVDAVASGVDRFAAAEPLFNGINVPDYPELASLAIDDATLAVADQLMGGAEFTFHHMHAARHDAGLDGVAWHHDYEQIPQTNRSHVQIHALHYLNGLDGSVG